LREVRKAKSEAKVKMRAAVAEAVVYDSAPRLAALRLGADDLCHAAVIERLELREGEQFSVEARLVEEAA
jgi:valyl-tRNA synthetase